MFFFKLIGFVQNKGVYSALKKYPGLYLFSKKKTKIKKWEPQNDLIFFLWMSSFKVQALGPDGHSYRWNDQLLK